MIDTMFIHGLDYYEEATNEYEKNKYEIDTILGNYAIARTRRSDLRSLGIFTESVDEVFTESAKDAVTSLGKKIISIIEKLKQFGKDLLDRLRGKKKMESEIEKKLKVLERENPELAKKARFKINAEDFKGSSVKDLNEYYKNVDELIERLKKEDIDPKSFRGKLSKMKDFLDRNSGTIKTVSVILGIAATSASLIGLKPAKKACRSVQEEYDDLYNRATATTMRIEDAQRALESLYNANRDDSKDPLTKIGLLANLTNEVNRVTVENLSMREKLHSRLLTFMGSVAEKAARATTKDSGKRNDRQNAVYNQMHSSLGEKVRQASIREQNGFEKVGAIANNLAQAKDTSIGG